MIDVFKCILLLGAARAMAINPFFWDEKCLLEISECLKRFFLPKDRSSLHHCEKISIVWKKKRMVRPRVRWREERERENTLIPNKLSSHDMGESNDFFSPDIIESVLPNMNPGGVK